MYWRVMVHPRARKAQITRMEGRELTVAVTAVPEKGRANRELVEILAKEFGVRKDEVVIVNGANARIKLVRIGHETN